MKRDLPEAMADIVSRRSDAELTVQRALQAVRTHLGMEVAYLSEFVGDMSVYRSVDAPGLEHLIKPGDSRSLDDVYCRHILAGRLPELIPDTAREPLAQEMPITTQTPIGSHASVPLRLPDGELYGMFCCLSPHPNTSLNPRDLQILRLFADMAGDLVSRDVAAERVRSAQISQVERVIAEKHYGIVFQPIWSFHHDAPVGFEALCRFHAEPYRPPNEWFDEAAGVGLGPALEREVLATTLEVARDLPDGAYLSVNASPELLTTIDHEALLLDHGDRQLVIEITEHAPVADYAVLQAALAPLRQRGVQLAVDDAGAGFSSLHHVLQLQPDIIKLDLSLTRGIDADAARRALASALIYFARETNATIVAEGVETEDERQTLIELGISNGQGYLLGRPDNTANSGRSPTRIG